MTQSTQTPENVKERLDEILNSDYLGYLYSRWLDESEYEDINDYGKGFEKNFPNTKVLRSTKRPFGFEIEVPEVPGGVYKITCNSRQASWKRIK